MIKPGQSKEGPFKKNINTLKTFEINLKNAAGSLVFSLDQEKALNRIVHWHLIHILDNIDFGFGLKFCRWYEIESSVLVNKHI